MNGMWILAPGILLTCQIASDLGLCAGGSHTLRTRDLILKPSNPLHHLVCLRCLVVNLLLAVSVAPRASSPGPPNIEGRAEVAVMRAVVVPLDRCTPVLQTQIWDWSFRVVVGAVLRPALGRGKSC